MDELNELNNSLEDDDVKEIVNALNMIQDNMDDYERYLIQKSISEFRSVLMTHFNNKVMNEDNIKLNVDTMAVKLLFFSYFLKEYYKNNKLDINNIDFSKVSIN